MKVLILGKMNEEEKFSDAENQLRADGNIPINPIKVMHALPEDISNGDFIAVLIELVRISNAVYLLDGWMHDLGASIAKRNAETGGKEIICQQQTYTTS